MSHKIAKAKRKFIRKVMPDIKSMPLSVTEGKFQGRLAGMKAEDINRFKAVVGYEPIATQIYVNTCRKYWYKRA